ncbi:hypothetical protein [Sorangium sp. So ce388]|uniref:hypothetical protein n=1 Tax=Sorangium sp. So ce388 TaxID=3133309 RepID=UPI003F5BCDBA
MQKSVYLLKMMGVEDFRTTSFKYHHYGPYSRSLSDTLQEVIVSGLLQEKRTDYGDEHSHSKYTYELTDAGRAWLEENADEMAPPIEQLAPTFKGSHWRVLELAATALFVERDENMVDRSKAIARAIELKPACAEYRSAAERLLKSIGL